MPFAQVMPLLVPFFTPRMVTFLLVASAVLSNAPWTVKSTFPSLPTPEATVPLMVTPVAPPWMVVGGVRLSLLTVRRLGLMVPYSVRMYLPSLLWKALRSMLLFAVPPTVAVAVMVLVRSPASLVSKAKLKVSMASMAAFCSALNPARAVQVTGPSAVMVSFARTRLPSTAVLSVT